MPLRKRDVAAGALLLLNLVVFVDLPSGSASRMHARMLADEPIVATMAEDYEALGATVAREYFDVDVVAELKSLAFKLVEEQWSEELLDRQFETDGNNNDSQNNDNWFLYSDDKTRLFVEPAAVDTKKDKAGNVVSRKLKYSPIDAVNKVGHAFHDLDPRFRRILYHPRVVRLLTGVGGMKRPVIAQSMVIFKGANKGGAVVPHQDSAFLTTKPLTCMGVWIPLEPSGPTNGGLAVWKGSHRSVPMIRRMKLLFEDHNGTARRLRTGFVKFSEDEWKLDETEDVDKDRRQIAIPEAGNGLAAHLKDVEIVAANPGDAVIFDGELVHWSSDNMSNSRRPALTLHVFDAGSATWLGDNWIQRHDVGDSELKFRDAIKECSKMYGEKLCKRD